MAMMVMSLYVIILVLLEDTLRVNLKLQSLFGLKGHNPCFIGRYSQRIYQHDGRGSDEYLREKVVIILVLLEDTLRD